jgi:hypothetical protein
MPTEQKVESELEASERDKAIARFCEVIADYGLPIPIYFQKGFNDADRADSGRSPRTGGTVSSRS